MAITSSRTTPDGHTQPGGGRYHVEVHEDDEGRKYGPFVFLLPEGGDATAAMNARALTIAAAMAEWEYRDRIKRVAALNLKWNTATQFADRMREDYRNLNKERLCALAWWVIEMITAGHVTDAQVRNAFGMTVNAYNTFKSNKLVPAHDHWSAVIVAEGE